MITCMTIPHNEQRYSTCGDWLNWGRNIEVRVSRMASDVSEMAVALHEQVEAFLCIRDGVKESDVTNWDLAWNAAGKDGEPGDDASAPYHEQHVAATQIEMLFIDICGMGWEQHESNVEALFKKDKTP